MILIDGKGQKTDTKQLHKPITDNCAIAPEFDFAKGTYDKGFTGVKGKALTREPLFIFGVNTGL